MAALAQTIDRSLEEAIMQVLRDAGHAVSLDELVQALQQQQINDLSEIRGAVWRLISDQQIDLTSDRKLLGRAIREIL